MEGKYLLYLEIFLLLLLFYMGNSAVIFTSAILTIITIAGLLLALWSFYNMGSKNFSPFPQPRKNGKIVQAGPYKYIRHPMYTGLVLVATALFLSNLNFINFLLFALFAYILDQKATLEEKLLLKMHKEYETYQKTTKRFLPYIY